MIKKQFVQALMLLFVLGLSSCLPNSRYNYLIEPSKAKKQNTHLAKADSTVYEFKIPALSEYRIKAGDWLIINIKSDQYSLNIDKEFSTGNNTRQMGGNQLQGTGAYFFSYLVDSLGGVNLPLVGSVNVRGNTLFQAEQLIGQEVRKFYKTSDIYVQVKNAQLYFSIIGEVSMQGFYQMQANSLSLLEAIALAGGLTPVANRSYVRLVRMYDGKPKMYSINVNDLRSLSRPEFYIQPKDIIIIDALPVRQIGLLNPTLKEGASLFFYLTSFLTFFKLI
jgi:polysaccharide export outer membrane protein